MIAPVTVGAATVAPAPYRPSVADTTAARRRTEWLFTALAGAVAVLLGLATLYLGRPTWGGPADLITAVLWGLGVTAAAGAAGFAAVQNDLTK